VGDMYHSLEAVIDLIHPRRRPKVIELLNEHTVHKTDYEHRIYRCHQCGGLRNVFWTRIVYDNVKAYETLYQCGQCCKPMMYINEPHHLNSRMCPCCGEKKLRISEDGFWH
jgi:hypothetical protein